jgi:hypothetical protein
LFFLRYKNGRSKTAIHFFKKTLLGRRGLPSRQPPIHIRQHISYYR